QRQPVVPLVSDISPRLLTLWRFNWFNLADQLAPLPLLPPKDPFGLLDICPEGVTIPGLSEPLLESRYISPGTKQRICGIPIQFGLLLESVQSIICSQRS